ncbi:hypothetical protein AVEN_48918-1 [Araneus ventricosus]|uniref:Uncharacterized protein n=1 Tax=Araneus ventricosus TaxID=182803 RepID=A0A4Y2AGG6_ARAVE|nr:hypothetical protein AVEN_48918-1 [Araneus ventricosus]
MAGTDFEPFFWNYFYGIDTKNTSEIMLTGMRKAHVDTKEDDTTAGTPTPNFLSTPNGENRGSRFDLDSAQDRSHCSLESLSEPEDCKFETRFKQNPSVYESLVHVKSAVV